MVIGPSGLFINRDLLSNWGPVHFISKFLTIWKKIQKYISLEKQYTYETTDGVFIPSLLWARFAETFRINVSLCTSVVRGRTVTPSTDWPARITRCLLAISPVRTRRVVGSIRPNDSSLGSAWRRPSNDTHVFYIYLYL